MVSVGSHEQPPPPPPPYSSRHMPPPSSPQQPQNNRNSVPPLSRAPPPPPPPPFSGLRDLPQLSSINRPGSSMSISSMLGSDAEAHPRDSAPPPSQYPPPPSTSTAMPSPNLHSMIALSQQPSLNLGSTTHPSYKRPQTPDRYPDTRLRGPREVRANSAGSPPMSLFGLGPGSPDHFRSGPLPHTRPQSFQQGLLQSSHLINARTPLDQQHPPARHPSGGTLPPRPNSQPAEFKAPPPSRHEDGQVSMRNLETTSVLGEGQGFGRQALEDRQRAVDREKDILALEQRDVIPTQEVERDRVETVQPVQESRFAMPSRHQTTSSIVDNERDVNKRLLFGGLESLQAFPKHRGQIQNDQPVPRLFGSGFQNYSNSSQSPFAKMASATVDDEPGQTGLAQSRNARDERNRSSLSFPTVHVDRRRQTPSQVPSAFVGTPHLGDPQSVDQQQSKGRDEVMQQQRSLFSLGTENARKNGRISPLPQAVQGVQGQSNGPGGEPGIKSEFGRMFSGIGSGLGSAIATAAPIGNGTQTPVDQSLSKRDDVGGESTHVGSLGEISEVKPSRSSSRGGRRARKVKEEDNKPDSESGDGRGTPVLMSARGAKRSRHSHHHHHHQHGHHHHHHHHKPDDEAPSPLAPQPSNIPAFTPFNTVKRTSTPLQVSSMTPTPVTHHHHHHHHHHHTTKTTPVIPVPPPQKPTVIVHNQALLDSVSNLPRKHLGTTLYAPRIKIPSSTASHDELKIGYVSTPTPLPRFEDKANCTFTIRIPREYLLPESREELVRRRAVWGTDVYTDDSDPLAAAVHAGWIRGEWAEDVDVSLFDLDANDVDGSLSAVVETNRSTTKDGQVPLTARPPAGPIVPLPNRDLHITLLILPCLEHYASTVAHGLKSRSWDDTHDGMSFKIDRIAWVDEGRQRGEERGGDARRKRLKLLGQMRAGTSTRFSLKTEHKHIGRPVEVAAQG
ncbi:MAG: hypothetical protein M1827_005109 [Pycnora praestabilis]|nr:MAG: hypothetical protein M1827_005109 [Pycnora praestabilis]